MRAAHASTTRSISSKTPAPAAADAIAVVEEATREVNQLTGPFPPSAMALGQGWTRSESPAPGLAAPSALPLNGPNANGQTQNKEVDWGPGPATTRRGMELSVPIGRSLATAAAGLGIPKMTYRTPSQHQFVHSRLPYLAFSMMFNKQSSQRMYRKNCGSLQAVSPLQRREISTQPSVSFKDFYVSVSIEEDRVIKIQVNVAGTMTDSTFEEIFRKNVAAAQPFPGFRRLKGGKTPEIPKEVALHLIGPSKVKKETIKKIVNSTVAEYVQKEGLNASSNLKVLQSFEELEAAFEPGKEFRFDAVIHLE